MLAHSSFLVVFYALLIGHALCDYPWQGDAVAKGKNRHNPPYGIPPGQKPVAVWFHYLTAHALIHSGSVWVITGNVWLGLGELFFHWFIDFAKCENMTNPHEDQILHIACKFAWTAILLSL
jgi:hypothetical protein